MKVKSTPRIGMELSASADNIGDFVFLDGEDLTSTLILSCRRATTQGEARMDADLFYLSSAEADDSMLSQKGVFSANNMDYKSVSYGHQWLRLATGYTFSSFRCARLLINLPPTEATACASEILDGGRWIWNLTIKNFIYEIDKSVPS